MAKEVIPRPVRRKVETPVPVLGGVSVKSLRPAPLSVAAPLAPRPLLRVNYDLTYQ